jgi:hypothetical protein
MIPYQGPGLVGTTVVSVEKESYIVQGKIIVIKSQSLPNILLELP